MIFIKFIGLIGYYFILNLNFFYVACWTDFLSFSVCLTNPCSYVPMFGETEYDPDRQYSSISIDEQLEALSRAVKAGKVSSIVK